VTHTWQVFNDYKLAEGLILYRCVFSFFFSFFLSSFFRCLIYEVTERISTKLGHTYTHDSLMTAIWKIWS